jgi:hypothetical protein
MTDPQTATGDPGPRLPPPTFFDPAFERLPAAAAWTGGDPGPVLLLFDPRADRAWVADAAIALATGWNAAGRRTVLADLSIEDPVLHERVGVPNLDGVVDLFLYGASLARSARPVPGRGFLLITAGTYTPDPEAIFRHPRWEKIVAGFREAQASLLLFAPLDARGLPALARWAAEAVVLGDRAEGELFESLVPPGARIRAWLTPPARPGADVRPVDARAAAAPQPAPPSVDRFPQPEPAAGIQPWNAPPREPAPRGPQPLPTAADAAHVPAQALPVPEVQWDDTVAPEPGGKTRKKKSIPKQRKVSPVLLVLLVLVLMAVAVGVAVAFLPGLLPSKTSGPHARAVGGRLPAPRPTIVAAPAGTPRPYAVFVRAYQGDGGHRAALDLASQVERDFPGTVAYVTPEEMSGVLYYKVMAGMLDDTAQAAALRKRLVDGHVASPDAAGGRSAIVQARPWAYDVGDFPSREAAQTQASALAARAIDTYAVPVPRTDGSESWTLYAGAYPDSARAEPMKKMLEAAGLPARLVRRVGRAPATSK